MTDLAKAKAHRHLSHIRYHQRFTLQESAEHGRPKPIRVTYADVDFRNYASGTEGTPASGELEGGPTLLLIGGMYGTRYMSAGHWSALARKHRLRVISADKFGLGGTDEVPLEWRVKSFMDLVVALLEHLNVKHVSLVSHSAGTIYILNIVLQLRHLLHPKNPFICLLSPWVHPSRSGEMRSLNMLPDAMLAQSDKILGFLNTNVAPAMRSSSDVFSVFRNLRNGRKHETSTENHDCDEEYDRTMDYCSHENVGSTFEDIVMRYVFAENAKGGAQDALLCLRRGPNVTWGDFEDFDDAIPKIFAAEEGRNGGEAFHNRSNQPGERRSTIDPGEDQEGRLRVKLFFAENDSFIGKKGRMWMDSQWRQHGSLKGNIIYESTVIEGSDHESIADVRFGVIDRVCNEVRQLWTS